MKKLVFLLLLGVCLMLFGCGGKKYNIDYHGQKELFKGAKDSYAAGSTVTLTYDLIGTDTDYYFYVDGKSFNAEWKEDKGYVLSFKMPEHDIEVYCESKNTMVYVPQVPLSGLYLQKDEALETPDNEVSMHIEDYDGQFLTAVICNNTKEDIDYGEDYSLEMLVDGEYISVDPIEDFCWIEIAYSLPPSEEASIQCDLSYYGDLKPGQYRLCKSPALTADFTLCEY